MNIFKKIFGSIKEENIASFEVDLNLEERHFYNELSELNTDARLGKIMAIGDSGNPKFLNILLHAILYSKDVDVKFSALKRLKNFDDLDKIKEFLLKLKEEKQLQKLEPYLSMALLNFELITEDEFNTIINGS